MSSSSSSSFAISAGDNKTHSSASRSIRRTWSSNESTNGGHGHGSKACVCAPATHAKSFKCRLHRVNSQTDQGHSTHSAPQPPVTNSSARTVVEAQ